VRARPRGFKTNGSEIVERVRAHRTNRRGRGSPARGISPEELKSPREMGGPRSRTGALGPVGHKQRTRNRRVAEGGRAGLEEGTVSHSVVGQPLLPGSVVCMRALTGWGGVSRRRVYSSSGSVVVYWQRVLLLWGGRRASARGGFRGRGRVGRGRRRSTVAGARPIRDMNRRTLRREAPKISFFAAGGRGKTDGATEAAGRRVENETNGQNCPPVGMVSWRPRSAPPAASGGGSHTEFWSRLT